MDKYQKETEKLLLDHEKEIFNQLKCTYLNALADIKKNVAKLKDQIDELTAADPNNKSLIQSKIYQLNYQKAMEEQLNEVLNVVRDKNVNNVTTFLKKMYEDSFLSINYHLQQKGIPVIMPINHKLLVDVLNIPTSDLKFSERLYKQIEDFKQTVKAEISRGIAVGSSYKDMARQISEVAKIDLNKSYRIARTEGGRVSSIAKMDSMREARKKGADIVKVWDSVLDNKTRPLHKKLDQQKAEIDEPFKVGKIEVMHPHGFGLASEDINCRCVLLSVPRWDLEAEVVKLDNVTKELITCKNYEDWKNKYYKINESKKKLYKEMTKLWLAKATPNSHKIKDMAYFEHEGVKYKVDGKNVVLDYSDKEKEIAEWLENTFGGEIYMVPRINNPSGIQTSDYIFRKENWDLKSINGKSKQALYHAIRKKGQQSNNFIFEILNDELTLDEIKQQVQSLYRRTDIPFLKKVIIKKSNDFSVFERK